MKINILFLILVLTSTFSYGQIKFEKGYLIDNENCKQECLIKNLDWWNNPSEFDYKLSENDSVKQGNIFTIKEFGISGISKFVRVDTKIDRSSVEITTLSTMRNPEWSEERLFLKVLIEGKASLYQYRERNSERYFYSVSDSSVKQLIYKEYYAKGTAIAYNNDFRQQLLNDVRNEETSMRSIENIAYSQSELEHYFQQYNKDNKQPTIIYDSNKNTDFIIFRVTPGMNYYSLSVMQNIYNQIHITTNTDQNLNVRLGLEANFILPFNKNKWGFVVEPSYQCFNSSTQNGSTRVVVDYQSIEFPIGLRYSFFLSDDLRLFLNGFLIPKFVIGFNSTVDVTFVSSQINLEISHTNSYTLGGGIDYKKFSVECRYYPNSNLLRAYTRAWTEYQRISVIIGYSLFKINHN